MRLRWVICTLTVTFLVSVADFARRTTSTFSATEGKWIGVVFTGQFSRVDAGLSLLEQGIVEALLISGVNPDAGMHLSGFPGQFKLSPVAMRALDSGQLVLDPVALNTLQNAAEAAKWVGKFPRTQSIVLITSKFHMARASLALEHAMGERAVMRYAVQEGETSLPDVVREYLKYLATLGWVLISE